jgi:LmbE family N-acetylglucosaminyl deacetylase
MTNISLPTDRATRWIFLSPHLDDAVFSCGGLISYLSGNGILVEIWTVFSDQSDDPSRFTEFARSLHARWQNGDQPYSMRKKEDAAASKTVGAYSIYLGFQDCIYRYLPKTREPVVTSEADLTGSINPGENWLIDQVAGDMHSRYMEPSIWVCPLGLGHHIDHQIVRKAAEKYHSVMLYYADLPYAISLPVQSFAGKIQLSFNLPEKNVQQWGKAILQYSSQVSTFWKTPVEMAEQYSAYLELYKGMPLWLPNPAGQGRK